MNFFLQSIIMLLSISIGMTYARVHLQKPSENEASKMEQWVRTSAITEVTVVEGCRAEIQCNITSSPYPYVEWVKELPLKTEKEFLERAKDFKQEGIFNLKSTFVIDSVKPSNEGPIYCVGAIDNKINFTQVILKVKENKENQCPEYKKPTIDLFASAVLSEIGNTVTLPCKISGKFNSVIWYLEQEEHQEVPISSKLDERFTTLQNNALQIRNISWDDMGLYKCVAQSEASINSVATFLYPVKPED